MRTKTFTLYCTTLAKRGFSLVLLMLSPTLLGVRFAPSGGV